MDFKTIELQIRQLEESFSKSRSNIYSDKKKESHFQELYELFDKIKNSNFTKFNPKELSNHNYILNVIFDNLEYLDSSTLNIIPFEIISCLEYALEDWINRENFIIVTSLSNRMNDFYLNTRLNEESFKLINQYIHNLYGIQFTHRLVQISLPKVLSRDYLSCVVLYHELGHFVDDQLNISSKLLMNEYGVRKPTNELQKKYFHHKMEYFADLFAAQYVNDSSNIYLKHIASGEGASLTHPSTNERITITEEFLNDEINDIINEFNKVLKSSHLPLLRKRYKEIKVSNCTFKDLYPQKFNSKDELHYIFKLGWDIWTNSSTNFLKTFTSREQYNIINNLIEKSISNYVVLENWKSTE